MGDEREQPRAANPEPQLKPDSRLSRMADLAERKIQLEVELLELKVAQAKKGLETPMRVPCGARLSVPQQDEDCACMLPLGHAEDYHLCKEGVGWS